MSHVAISYIYIRRTNIALLLNTPFVKLVKVFCALSSLGKYWMVSTLAWKSERSTCDGVICHQYVLSVDLLFKCNVDGYCFVFYDRCICITLVLHCCNSQTLCRCMFFTSVTVHNASFTKMNVKFNLGINSSSACDSRRSG